MADNTDLAQTFYRLGRKKLRVFVLLSAAALLVGALAVSFGTYRISFMELVDVLRGCGQGAKAVVVWNIRAPRVGAALTVGWGLALSGLFIQVLLRNPLGSASTLGISQGAAFGASLAIIGFGGGLLAVTGFAFLGAVGATLVVALLARLKGFQPEAVILAGVALASLFGAATVLLQYLADETRLAMAVVWSFGDVGRSNWNEIALLAAFVALLTGVALAWRWRLNALEAGEEPARSLGVPIDEMRWQGLALAALVAALATAFHGVIAFVGLVAPHAARKLVGPDHRFLIPVTGAAGALLLTAADTFSRFVFGSGSFPVGVTTSFLGAPLFLYLLLKGSKWS